MFSVLKYELDRDNIFTGTYNSLKYISYTLVMRGNLRISTNVVYSRF